MAPIGASASPCCATSWTFDCLPPRQEGVEATLTTDVDEYPVFNAAYAQRFPAASAPARSTVVSGLIAPVKVEIEAVAVRPA